MQNTQTWTTFFFLVAVRFLHKHLPQALSLTLSMFETQEESNKMRSAEIFEGNLRNLKPFLRLELKFTVFFHDC